MIKLAVGGHRCVVRVILRLHAEAAARERLPEEALVRPAIAVSVRLDNCVARR
jgi:DNA-binding TFAR19-related protein (PDSD5 family)